MRRGEAAVLLDVVPEHFPYRDDGCEVSPSCLSCPLPQCKYDDPAWFQREKQKKKDGRVMAALRADGLSVQEVAVRFEISQRTIFRILRRWSDEKQGASSW